MGQGEVKRNSQASTATPFLLETDSDVCSQAEQAVAEGARVVRCATEVAGALDLVGFAPRPDHVVLKGIGVRGSLPLYVLDGGASSTVHHGQVLATPDAMRQRQAFVAAVFFAERYEKMTQQPLQGICRSRFSVRHTGVFGTLHLPAGKDLSVAGVASQPPSRSTTT
jgi:translation elongation factor EF-Tu-like GTPase